MACRKMKPKAELFKVVRTGTGAELDEKQNKSGRGAYVCRNLACFEKARKARRFERSLSCKIPDEVYEQMQSELAAADGE